MTTISISITWVDPPPHPNLIPGVHSIAEIMPSVLASHGLSMQHDVDVMPTLAATEVLIGVMLDALEAALAS